MALQRRVEDSVDGQIARGTDNRVRAARKAPQIIASRLPLRLNAS